MTEATQALAEAVTTEVILSRVPLQDKLAALPGFALMRVTEMLLETGAGAIAQAAQELGVLSNTSIGLAPALSDEDLVTSLPAWLNVVSEACLRVVSVVILEAPRVGEAPRVHDSIGPSVAPSRRLLSDVTLTVLHDTQRGGWQPLLVAQDFSPWRPTQLAFRPYVVHPPSAGGDVGGDAGGCFADPWEGDIRGLVADAPSWADFSASK